MAKTIEEIIRDAQVGGNDAADAKRFSGYLGTSDIPTRTRLYLDEQLDEYLEFSTAELIATIDLGGKNSPFVLLLTQPNAIVQLTSRVSKQVEAGFLAGAISRHNLRADRPFWPQGPGLPDVKMAGGSIRDCDPPPTAQAASDSHS